MNTNYTKTNEIIELNLNYAQEVLMNDNKFGHYFNYENKEKVEEKKGIFLKALKCYIITTIINNLEMKEIDDEDNLYNRRRRKI